MYSVIFDLNFGIYNVQFNEVLTVIKAYEFELAFVEMWKISKNRPIKLAGHESYQLSYRSLVPVIFAHNSPCAGGFY